MERPPRLVLTGAAGFLGKRLIERLAGPWQIEAIDREPPVAGMLAHRPEVRWHRIDLTDDTAVTSLFAALRADGGATAVVHLAAHYDFTGERHPDYQRTNVEGTRRLLDACDGLGLERFVFASSLAACEFPRAGRMLDESSPPDGDHVYAESKRAGEVMMRAERRFPTAIIRFAALYSDWCEYAPLFSLLRTWLSGRWNSRILGGRGRSAVPYLHVRDAGVFAERLLDLRRELEPAEVLIASPNRVTSHADLFRAVTAYVRGAPVRPICTPRAVATLGLHLLDLAGRASGNRPFERPWMGRMIDRRLEVDPHQSYRRLSWTPRPRLDIVRRIPFLIENQYSEPGTWAAHNEAALHSSELLAAGPDPPSVRGPRRGAVRSRHPRIGDGSGELSPLCPRRRRRARLESPPVSAQPGAVGAHPSPRLLPHLLLRPGATAGPAGLSPGRAARRAALFRARLSRRPGDRSACRRAASPTCTSSCTARSNSGWTASRPATKRPASRRPSRPRSASFRGRLAGGGRSSRGQPAAS